MKKALFIILTALFILSGGPARQANSAILLDRVVAKVNSDIITWSELRKRIEIEDKDMLKGLTDEEREKRISLIEKPFLDSMIDMRLQIQEAHKLGIGVSSSETNDAVSDIRKKYDLTDESLAESLRAEGYTLEEYMKQLSDQILLSKVVRAEVRDTVLVPDKEVDEYYQTNKENIQKEEKVKIRQILFILRDSSQRADLETKAEEAIQRIKKGEDFSKMAGELTEDSNRQFGGDLGYISRGSVLKEIEDEAFSLKVGEVSSPFWSSRGLHIIKVEDKIGDAAIEKTKAKIREMLFEKAFKSKYEDWIKKLREQAYIEMMQ
ncbi:MAG: peptidylprolyl isomerase [Nitrospirae bacterium]|nr:peptidylprolyl isomerase [Nitrospirota bacterium]